MNIRKENIGDLHEMITIELVPEDYQSQVRKSLNNLRQTVNIPGFRKKMVPIEIIKKIHGKSVRGEEITKLMENKIFAYIQENNLNVFFNPIPRTDKVVADFDRDGDFSFSFEIGLCPEIKINYDDLKDVVIYKVVATEQEIDEKVKILQANASTFSSTETVAQGDILLVSVFFQDKEFTSTLRLDYIKSEEQEPIIGKRLHEEMDIDTEKMFVNDYARSTFLNLKIEELETAPVNVHIKINAIHHQEIPDIDEKFFTEMFPDGTITTEAVLRENIKIQIEQMAIPNINLLYHKKIMAALTDNISSTLILPDALIKKYFVEVLKEYTLETIDENYVEIKRTLILQLINQQLLNDFNIAVYQNEIINSIYQHGRQQYFGAIDFLNEEQEEQLKSYTKEIMKDKNNITHVYNNLVLNKTIQKLKETLNPTVKEIFYDEFMKEVLDFSVQKTVNTKQESDIEKQETNQE